MPLCVMITEIDFFGPVSRGRTSHRRSTSVSCVLRGGICQAPCERPTLRIVPFATEHHGFAHMQGGLRADKHRAAEINFGSVSKGITQAVLDTLNTRIVVTFGILHAQVDSYPISYEPCYPRSQVFLERQERASMIDWSAQRLEEVQEGEHLLTRPKCFLEIFFPVALCFDEFHQLTKIGVRKVTHATKNMTSSLFCFLLPSISPPFSLLWL